MVRSPWGRLEWFRLGDLAPVRGGVAISFLPLLGRSKGREHMPRSRTPRYPTVDPTTNRLIRRYLERKKRLLPGKNFIREMMAVEDTREVSIELALDEKLAHDDRAELSRRRRRAKANAEIATKMHLSYSILDLVPHDDEPTHEEFLDGLIVAEDKAEERKLKSIAVDDQPVASAIRRARARSRGRPGDDPKLCCLIVRFVRVLRKANLTGLPSDLRSEAVRFAEPITAGLAARANLQEPRRTKDAVESMRSLLLADQPSEKDVEACAAAVLGVSPRTIHSHLESRRAFILGRRDPKA